ncbi:MAG TPA: hypothetical protein VIU65_06005 [Pyrinomonadaceae bacterium]
MNTSRIEVPLALPEPHFEDEATVVTARQVVPLNQARLQDRRRKLLVILPLLLAATFCGGLGAIAVNYFGRQVSAPAIPQPSTSTTTEAPQPVAPAPSPDNAAAINATATSTVSPDEPKALPPSGSAVASDSPAADAVEKSSPAKSDETVASMKKPSSPADPKQLVRPRRVHPLAGEPGSDQHDPPKSRGAARIQDIFSGPNP